MGGLTTNPTTPNTHINICNHIYLWAGGNQTHLDTWLTHSTGRPTHTSQLTPPYTTNNAYLIK